MHTLVTYINKRINDSYNSPLIREESYRFDLRSERSGEPSSEREIGSTTGVRDQRKHRARNREHRWSEKSRAPSE
jgi:hypothetical protein